MLNHYDFEGKIKGTKNDVRDFMETLERSESYRVFEIYSLYKNGDETAYFEGCGAWSLFTMLSTHGCHKILKGTSCLEDFAKTHPMIEVEIIGLGTGRALTERVRVKRGEAIFESAEVSCEISNAEWLFQDGCDYGKSWTIELEE